MRRGVPTSTARYSGFFCDAAENTHLLQNVHSEERGVQREGVPTRAPYAALTSGRKERVFRAPGCLQEGFRVPRPFQQSQGSRNQKSARKAHRKGRWRGKELIPETTLLRDVCLGNSYKCS